jgi:glyoxylase-like metal-dependent hydrolase (beta-lactamase superfamily II)
MAASLTLNSGPARFEGGLREVAPRTWAWLQPNGGLGEANAGLIVGDGESLLVDTLWSERLAYVMLLHMQQLLAGAPLRRAFITHPDGDHWWGNARLDRSVEIVATPACDRAMRAEAPPRALSAMTAAAGALRRVPGRLGAAARFGHAQLEPFAWSEVRRRYADRTIDGGATLDVGGRAVRVLDLGPTHSAADAVLHLPDVGVVFAADLLFIGVTPIMWHGPVETWLRALDALLALDADVYVPGHGPPCGRAEIELLADYWRWLYDRVAAQRAFGRSPGEAARELLRSPEQRRFADWLNPERTLVNVATMCREPGELSPPARARLLAQMWWLGAELASARP